MFFIASCCDCMDDKRLAWSKRGVWPIGLYGPYVFKFHFFFFYSLLTTGTCGKPNALSRGDIQRSPCSAAKIYKQTRWSSVFRFPRLLLSLHRRSHYGNCSGSHLGLVFGRVSEVDEVQLSPCEDFLTLPDPILLLLGLALKSYNPAHGFLPGRLTEGEGVSLSKLQHWLWWFSS